MSFFIICEKNCLEILLILSSFVKIQKIIILILIVLFKIFIIMIEGEIVTRMITSKTQDQITKQLQIFVEEQGSWRLIGWMPSG